MAATYFAPRVNQQFLIPSTGLPANGAQLFCYAAGTTTKTTVYKDNAAAASWSNPIVLDSGGNIPSQGEIWQSAGVAMKYVFAPSNDTDPPTSAYATFDNLVGSNDPTGVVTEWVLGPTPTYLSSTSFSLVGDQTLVFQVGRRIKATVTAGTVYAFISTTAFGSTTTVTVDSAVLDSGLSAVSYGLVSETNSSLPKVPISIVTNPSGSLYPGEWTTFTPTVTLVGGAGNTVPVYSTNTGRYTRIGNTIVINVTLSGDGGAEGAGTGAVNVALPVNVGASASIDLIAGKALNGATSFLLEATASANASTVSLGYFDAINSSSGFTGVLQNNVTRSIRLGLTYEA